jgi:hypothetical protein
VTTTAENAPRPPDGDWLRSPFLRLDREGPVIERFGTDVSVTGAGVAASGYGLPEQALD